MSAELAALLAGARDDARCDRCGHTGARHPGPVGACLEHGCKCVRWFSTGREYVIASAVRAALWERDQALEAVKRADEARRGTEESLSAALDVLGNVEWVSDYDAAPVYRCPVCRCEMPPHDDALGEVGEHAVDCELAAVLRKAGR